MDPEAVALALAKRIRRRVAPLLGHPGSRARHGTAHGGDPTYAIDRRAEEVAVAALGDLEDVAYFTEDDGLVVRGQPRTLFLIDPIDGTRPAAAGYETCCTSVAVAPYGDGVTLADVTYGCVVELATGASFEASRGRGATVQGRTAAPSDATRIDDMFWAGGFRGQPAVLLSAVLAGLFDVPGSGGAFFDQGSAAYSLTRIVTGQLDAFVDPGPLLIERLPETETAFRRVGGGEVLNTVTYDAAAAYLVLREVGCPLTDAAGAPLDDVPLLDDHGRASMVSSVAASTPELHTAVVSAVGEGIDRARRLIDAAGLETLAT